MLSVQPLQAATETKSQKQDVQRLTKLLKNLQAELKRERSKRSKEEKRLSETEQKISELNDALRQLDNELKQINANLSSYFKTRENLVKRIAANKAALSSLLKQRYQMGRAARLKLLLNQSDPEKVSRVMMYFDKVHQSQQLQLSSYRELLQTQSTNNNNIDVSQSRLVKQQAKIEAQKSQLELTRTQRKEALSVLDRKIQKNRTKIKRLSADKKRLEKVIVRIEKVLPKIKVAKDTRPFRVMKGKLMWPVKGKVYRSFGSLENNLAYDGLLIKAKQGESVKVAHSGRVVFANWLRSYGMVMIVDHGKGYMTLYGHNDQLLKKAGDLVSTGEIIAKAGSSGGNDKPGLYFAIRYNGRTTNPRPWLSGR